MPGQMRTRGRPLSTASGRGSPSRGGCEYTTNAFFGAGSLPPQPKVNLDSDSGHPCPLVPASMRAGPRLAAATPLHLCPAAYAAAGGTGRLSRPPTHHASGRLSRPAAPKRGGEQIKYGGRRIASAVPFPGRSAGYGRHPWSLGCGPSMARIRPGMGQPMRRSSMKHFRPHPCGRGESKKRFSRRAAEGVWQGRERDPLGRMPASAPPPPINRPSLDFEVPALSIIDMETIQSLQCCRCGSPTAGREHTPGARSAICDRCFADETETIRRNSVEQRANSTPLMHGTREPEARRKKRVK